MHLAAISLATNEQKAKSDLTQTQTGKSIEKDVRHAFQQMINH